MLGAEVNANMYATPVGQGRTFPPHTDQTDIFVLQLAGRKRWQAWYEQQRPFFASLGALVQSRLTGLRGTPHSWDVEAHLAQVSL